MVELNNEQCARTDDVENAVFEMCKVLTENSELDWNMAIIGPIADFAAEVLTQYGFSVRYPAIVEGDDGEEYIADYWQP